MKNTLVFFLASMICLFSCQSKYPKLEQKITTSPELLDLSKSLGWPKDLAMHLFSGPDLTPSPACLAVAVSGEVFVGVDQIGSLGREPGKGKIVKLVDSNNDGTADSHTIFAHIDNPRGIIPLGDKVYVLHTIFSETEKIATGMDLVVFTDEDGDGVADGPSVPLIKHLSPPKFLQSRGTDHATNGIRLGIDGWIYIAVGDFGFYKAIDNEGTELTMLGGGIIRVRPDGTGMEIYSHGSRNIYDIAIDPYMNIFTRGNTNDGGGWNIRFSHQIQTGEYGYPVLFKHFSEEIIPALADLGGGSGTGALFLNDDNWPSHYNNVPMMADWGRNQLFIHRLIPDGPSFTQKEEKFIKLPQITDLDIDGSGRVYMSAWDGAGYTGSNDKGFVLRVVPIDWEYKEFPNLKIASLAELGQLLNSGSNASRISAQQELLSRDRNKASEVFSSIMKDEKSPTFTRIAAMYGYSQVKGVDAIDDLLELVEDYEMKEYAIRAVTDRRDYLKEIHVDPFLKSLNDDSPRVKAAAIIALGRIKNREAIPHLLNTQLPTSFKSSSVGKEGRHADPNAEIILPHLAVKALVSLEAVNECINAIGGENSTIALWALKYMHTPEAVDGLIQKYKEAYKNGDEIQSNILETLSRLYTQEAPYEGTWWWGTRPDTQGPYYKSVTWESSNKIKLLFDELWEKGKRSEKKYISMLNQKNRMGIQKFGGEYMVAEVLEKNDIDLEKIKKQKGQVGESSIEDIILALNEIPGDPILGKTIYDQQGCRACHSIEEGEPLKGPYMGQIGSIMNQEQIAESILKPNASISQGFATIEITTSDDITYIGFITHESADRVIMRNIAGKSFIIRNEDIVDRKELEYSMMPEGLVNSLSYEELASLVIFLSNQKDN